MARKRKNGGPNFLEKYERELAEFDREAAQTDAEIERAKTEAAERDERAENVQRRLRELAAG